MRSRDALVVGDVSEESLQKVRERQRTMSDRTQGSFAAQMSLEELAEAFLAEFMVTRKALLILQAALPAQVTEALEIRECGEALDLIILQLAVASMDVDDYQKQIDRSTAMLLGRCESAGAICKFISNDEDAGEVVKSMVRKDC